MARMTPASAALPLALPVNDSLVRAISRPDQSLIGGARGGVYSSDAPGSTVGDKLRECRSQSGAIGPATSTSPLGARR
jgi:hypothetical protein